MPTVESAASPDAVVSRVRIGFRSEQLAVYATERVVAGDEILFVHGPVTNKPSRFSVQIGIGEHVEPDDETGLSPAATKFPWRFMNHSCAPSAMLRGRWLLARRDLEIGDEVTFDYDSTEWEMAEPFVCACADADCRGRIAGFRHLDAGGRVRLMPLLAAHLSAIAQGVAERGRERSDA